ncbi:MAG: GSCFA domain-containing protein [Pikeienuella sp.]
MSDRTQNPYEDLPATAFWRTGVAEQPPLATQGLYQPRFKIGPRARIFTAGSCFAQHVGRALRANGFTVLDAEPAPASVSDAVARRFGYRMYSARYGNIYTARQMVQLLQETAGVFTPAEPVWRRVINGRERFFDSQRPAIEPDGLASEQAVLEHRARHLSAVSRAVATADVFVFTLGLTEAWVHRQAGDVYPTAPGAIAGEFDPEVYAFKNFTVDEVFRDFARFRRFVRRIRPRARFVLTVSPVPLTATASGKHVQVASTYSKAVLRAVAGMAYDRFSDVDYMPSYEIITSPANHGVYFEANKRSVTPQGVAAAMDAFMSGHARAKTRTRSPRAEDIQCEESLLEAFAKR